MLYTQHEEHLLGSKKRQQSSLIGLHDKTDDKNDLRLRLHLQNKL